MNPLPWQPAAIKVLSEAIRSNRSALDASETGTGKTAHALFAAKACGLPVAVICPKSVIPAWKEMAAAIGVQTVFVLNVEQLKAKQSFVQGDKLRWTWILPRCVLVWDECHRAASDSSEAAAMLASAPKPCIMLSATAADSPLKLRAIGHQLGITTWRDWWSWCGRYGCKRGHFGGLVFKGTQEHLDRIHRQIFTAGLGVRVRIAEIPDFPQNTIETVAVPVEDQKSIDAAYEAELQALESNAPNAAVEMLRARQIAEHQKLEATCDLIEDLLDSGNSVAVFVHFTESRETIERIFPKSVSIYGEQGDDSRQFAIRQFQSDDTPLIVCQIQAGGVGLSLHDVNGKRPRVSIIFPGWSAVELKQALGRIHRAGAKSPALQKIIFSEGTVEQRIRDKVNQKLKNIETLVDGDLTMSKAPKVETIVQEAKASVEKVLPTAERPHANLSPSKLKNLELSPQWVQDKNQEEHPVTEAGQRMHSACETREITHLNEEELGLVQKCLDFADQIPGERCAEVKLDIARDCYGYADLIIIKDGEANLIDFKFGFNAQEDAETNPAAQAYVLGILNKWPDIQTVQVYYLYPRLDSVSHATYTREDQSRILLRLAAIKARVASGQCEPHYETCLYCGNKATCAYLKKFALPIATRYAGSHDLQLPAEYEPSLITDPATMSKALAVAQVLERWCESVKFSALRLRQESGQEIPGYDMRSRQGRKKIILPNIAWQHAEQAGVTKDEFMSCCEISVAKLSEIVSDKAKRGEKKKAAQKFEDDLRDLAALEIGPDTFYLTRTKK